MAALKLDENVPDSVGVIFRDGGHDVALARDEQLAGVADDQVLVLAGAEGRVLVTLDRDFTNILRHSPEETAGIVVFACMPRRSTPCVKSRRRSVIYCPGSRRVADCGSSMRRAFGSGPAEARPNSDWSRNTSYFWQVRARNAQGTTMTKQRTVVERFTTVR